MSQPEARDAPSLPVPPAGGAPPGSGGEKFKTTFGTAVAAVAGIVLAATAFQNLWQHAGPLLEESRRITGILPLVILGGVTAAVALAIVVLVARRMGKLILSVRMTAAVLAAAALLLLASTPFEPEGEAGPRSAAGAENDRTAERFFGKAAGDKVMLLARTAGFTDISRSWALYALLGLLALGSAAGLIWRRPVGAREFGFLALHGGLLLVLGGLVANALFGYYQPLLEMGVNAPPAAVPGGAGAEAAFSLVVRRIDLEELPLGYRVWAFPPKPGGRERLPLRVEPGEKIRWRDFDIEVIEFREEEYAEPYLEKVRGRAVDPVVRVEVSGGGKKQEVAPKARYKAWTPLADLNMEIRYQRCATAAEAEEACRRPRGGEPERLMVISSEGERLDEAELPFGREKVGKRMRLAKLGVLLEVLRYFSGAKLERDGKVTQAPPYPGVPSAVEVRPVKPAGSPAEKPPDSFWILGLPGPTPLQPHGKVPPELAGLRFVYGVRRWAPRSLRIVEGPEGTFHLAELRDGKIAKVHPVAVGGTLQIEGAEVRLLEFLKGARLAYRPAPKSEKTVGPHPAVRLAVGRGVVREKIWFFPGILPTREVLGVTLAVRPVKRGCMREAVTVEVLEGKRKAEQVVLERGRALSRGGYRVLLGEIRPTGVRSGKQLGRVRLVVSRDPALWFVLAGMVLMGLGAPWLLWSRFRYVPDPGREEI